MSDEPPDGLTHLGHLFDKFGELWTVEEIRTCADNLGGDELSALTAAYAEIGRDDQLRRLTDWINEPGVPARQRHLRRGAFVLLQLFEELGEKAIFPFADRAVRYIRKYPPRDWMRVPTEYQFLGPMAERFGIMLYERGWDETLGSISPAARSKMAELGEELRSRNLVLAVQDWMNAQPEPNVEVTALDGLLQLLDNFGMLDEDSQ